jgi:hypothetical protein
MASGIQIAVTVTRDREVGLRLDRFPKEVHDRLLARIRGLTDTLRAEIVARAPKGKTGELADSIDTRVTDSESRIRGTVFVDANFGKAGAIEYGAHGTAKVAAHEERRTNFFGRVGAVSQVDIGAHSRQLNIAAHRYMRGPLAADSADIEQSLHQALNEAAQAG